MTGTVVISPRVVVVIRGTLGNDLLKELREVFHKTGLKLDRRDSRGGTGNKDSRLAFLKSALFKSPSKCRCDVFHVAMATRL